MRTRVALAVIELFLAGVPAGMTGLLGGGIRYPKSWPEETPFRDFTVPALALGVVAGGAHPAVPCGDRLVILWLAARLRRSQGAVRLRR